MSDDSKSIKEQRDRFLAFSFASADLFIEVSMDGKIVFALGAARSLTGIDESKLKGRKWLELFDLEFHAQLIAMRKDAKVVKRCGPLQVTLDKELGGGRETILTAIRMPGTDSLYLTLGFPSNLMKQIARTVAIASAAAGPADFGRTETVKEEPEVYSLHDKESFIYAAGQALDTARSVGQKVEMTLFDIPDPAKIKKRLGAELWDKFTTAITDLFASHSLDGNAAAEIKEGRYSVLHDKKVDFGSLMQQLTELTKSIDPEGKGFAVTGKTVSADLASLSERETTKALIYTINEYERKGTSLSIENLNSGFRAYVTANAQKISQFKTMVTQLNFDFHFLPIANLEKSELSHYEMLARFKEGGSTQEWIVFAEDTGMAAEFDIAVCERAINFLTYKAANNRNRFAINLSGQSIQNEQFFKTLHAKLSLNKALASRIIFEITESSLITELDMVNHFIGILQNDGYEICLDDFGTGSGSFQYLQMLHVNYVKIDGVYTTKILKSERDQLLVKNISRLCRDLRITTIAERIENAEQVELMKKLGIQLGQGYYFGRPEAKPNFEPGKLGMH
jgi:EAL domain-containing protein (putative c-di-GMP-specific phosphodiesterase class I)